MEETYRELPAKDSGKPSSQLLDYFNEKSILKNEGRNLEDIFCSSSTKYFKIFFSEKTKCFKVKDLNIDFPSNWSVFKALHMAFANNVSLVLNINEFDSSMLYPLLSKFCEYEAKIYITCSKDGMYLAFPRVEDMSFEETVNKYFSLEDKAEDTESDLNSELDQAAA